MGKKVPCEQECANLTTSLQKSFDRWVYMNTNGSFDPHYSDGMNMNLVRNHIIYDKRKIKELCEAHGLPLPEVYHRETPPEVPFNYMVKASEILERANANLVVLLAEPSVTELKRLIHELDGPKLSSAEGILRRLRSLQDAVSKGNLVEMRRFEDITSIIDGARELAGGIVTGDLKAQLSLFAFMDDKSDVQAYRPAADGKKHKRPVR